MIFPHPLIHNHDGIVAMGGDLCLERLISAYRHGIFPWYNADDPILWWFLNPRMILYPCKLKVSKSMRSYFNQEKFQVTIDTCFEQVIRNCKMAPRDDQEGTWIHEDMINAYTKLHHHGHAHSVEVWDGEELVGGLYGVALGKIFYGESMFAKRSNASKYGFITLVQALKDRSFELIDCQQRTSHLGSLGAEEIDGDLFYALLRKNRLNDSHIGKWTDWI